MAREKLCLGVDIGASGIKLCQLRRQRDEIALEHFCSSSPPTECGFRWQHYEPRSGA